MKMVIIDKELWAYVDGDKKTAPTQGDQVAAWHAKDQKALSTLCLSVKDTELIHLTACDTSAKAWKKLHDVHEDKGLARRLFLRRALISARIKDGYRARDKRPKFWTLSIYGHQGRAAWPAKDRVWGVTETEGESLQEHVNHIIDLTQQLASIGATVPDEDIAITLLCSLPESYDNLIIALESRADALTTEVVTARFLQEETRRKGSAMAIKQDNAALLSKGKGKGNGKGNNQGGQRRDRPKCYRLLKNIDHTVFLFNSLDLKYTSLVRYSRYPINDD